MLGAAVIRSVLSDVLTEAYFPELPNYYQGKVRENYDLPDKRRILISTDRQSAFDQVLAAVPFKGCLLTQIARFWFETTLDICPNHVLDYPDPNVVVGRQLSMLPVEMVVRDYLTGSTDTSIWTMYRNGRREVYGITLPDGLEKNDLLPMTILTPTTKAPAGGHDMPVTPDEIMARGLLTKEQWEEMARLSLALFGRGRDIALRRGLILVDSKFEFGLDENGRITLADEVLTPDSSRYWLGETYDMRHFEGKEPESLDKEFLRLWIAERCDPYREPIPSIPDKTLVEFAAKYISLYETITGRPFVPPPRNEPVKERIRRNLTPYFSAA